MLTRHRIPTIFNIYMLDVICCALGCVILLWQVNHQEAEEQTAAAREAEQRWRQAALAVDSFSSEVEALKLAIVLADNKSKVLAADLVSTQSERDDAKKAVLLREQEYAKLKQAFQFSEALLKNTRGDLEKLRDQQKLTATDLADRIKSNAELLLQVSAAESKARSLEKEVGARKLDASEAAKRLQEQLALLAAADTRAVTLEKQVGELKLTGKETLTKLTLNELRLKVLEQELERGKQTVQDGDQRVRDLLLAHERLSKQLIASAKDLSEARSKTKALQVEAEQRFAGIALTGRKVLFLVDMSGSMELIDVNTLDPDKWPLVCETVAQLMKSISGLEQYQVILFSEKVRYPMGFPGNWLSYDPDTSPKNVQRTLKATKPEGETNLHGAFSEAFRFRESGLDTIYVLSDGLPNAGEGLPVGKNLTDSQKTDLLSKHLRNKLRTEWNRPIAGRSRVRINTIGYFFESPDVGAFLWALAREHDGSFVGMSRP